MLLLNLQPVSPAAVAAAAAGRPPYRARGQGRAPSFLRWPPLHVLGRGRSAGVRNAFTFASEVLCHVLLLPRALPRAPRSARRRVLPRATAAAAAAAVSPAIASPTLVPSPTRRGKEPYLSADLPVALYLGAPPPRPSVRGGPRQGRPSSRTLRAAPPGALVAAAAAAATSPDVGFVTLQTLSGWLSN